MTKNFPQHWTLQTASDITFAPVWYRRNIKQGCFYYHNEFITDIQKFVIPNGRIFSICLLPNNPIFTIVGGRFYDRR